MPTALLAGALGRCLPALPHLPRVLSTGSQEQLLLEPLAVSFLGIAVGILAVAASVLGERSSGGSSNVSY